MREVEADAAAVGAVAEAAVGAEGEAVAAFPGPLAEAEGAGARLGDRAAATTPVPVEGEAAIHVLLVEAEATLVPLEEEAEGTRAPLHPGQLVVVAVVLHDPPAGAGHREAQAGLLVARADLRGVRTDLLVVRTDPREAERVQINFPPAEQIARMGGACLQPLRSGRLVASVQMSEEAARPSFRLLIGRTLIGAPAEAVLVRRSDLVLEQIAPHSFPLVDPAQEQGLRDDREISHPSDPAEATWATSWASQGVQSQEARSGVL